MSSDKIRLIVCDIEGCIMPPNRGMVLPQELSSIVDYCRAAGRDKNLPPLVFCTGRQIPYAECVAQLTNAFFPGFYSVVENGAFLYDVARNEIVINPAAALNLDGKEGLPGLRAEVRRIIERFRAKKEYGKEICISLNPPADLPIESFYEEVKQSLDSFGDLVEISHSKSAVDITPVGIDKASGVRLLAQKTGVAPEEMLGIGDTRGDLPMLKIVGFPACPANAAGDVKSIASFIAPSHGARGVAEILDHFTSWEMPT